MLIQQLLSALGDDERMSLDHLQLPLRLTSMLHYFLQHPQSSSQQYCADTGITIDYYKRSEQLLIRQICEHLVPGGYAYILQFLFEKRLFEHYKMFIAIYERRFKNEGWSDRQLFDFYRLCCKHLLYFEKPDTSLITVIERYAKLLASYPSKRYPDEHRAVEAALLSLRLIHINSNKRLSLAKKRVEAEQILKRWQHKYYTTISIRAKYYYLLARSRYYTHYKQKNIRMQQRIYEQAGLFLQKYPSLFDDLEKMTFKLRLARYHLINNNREQSYSLYSRIYAEAPGWSAYGAAHYFGYLRSMLQVDQAQEVLSAAARIRPEIRRIRSQVLELGLSLVTAEALMHVQRFDEARAELKIARRLMNARTYYHTYDVSFRINETTLAYFLGKWHDAHSLAEKHIRWFKENDPHIWEEVIVYFRFIQAVINYKLTGNKMLRKYQNVLKGDYSILSSFPPRMLQMILHHQPVFSNSRT